MGLLQERLDIFDDADVERHVPEFLAAYSPGQDWSAVSHENARPWSYYHHDEQPGEALKHRLFQAGTWSNA
jgi:hypothetical protein